ncbi:MAG: hypothetical protein ABSD28_17445 [Tepidisphaeraceae bacterium]|jgi:hypothetical protein
MLKRVFLGVVSVLALSAVSVHADPKDDIKSAVQKLADSPNYSWSTTIQGGFGRGPQEGKTEKGGYTSLTIQMRDNSFDAIIKGDKAAIKTDSGWKSAAEILAEPVDAGGPPPPEFRAAMVAQNSKTPAGQAQDNLDSLQNIQKTDDGYTADLTADAAKTLLQFGPRRPRPTTSPDGDTGTPPPQFEVSDAKGTLKLAVKDGNLTQIEFHLTGTVSFNGNDRDVDRTVTTDIKDVGTTKVEVPDEAKAKLSS